MKPHPTAVRLVVLDWAGTTIDFGSRAPVAAFQGVFAARGVTVSEAEARGPMGTHKKDHLRALLADPGIAARWKAARGQDWAEADLEAMYAELVPRQIASAAEFADLVPGVLETAEVLRGRGVRLAGTTGYFRAAMDVVEAAARSQGYWPDANVCGDDVPAGRPAPWMVYAVMQRLGVYPPAAVVKVGDTPVDIEEGLNAGTWSVGVCTSSSEMGLSEAELRALAPAERRARLDRVRRRFESLGAHAVIDTLAELPDLVEEITARMGRGERP